MSTSPSSLNAYMVRTKDMRSYTIPILDDGSGPEEPVWPMSPVVAETAAQAKYLFLYEFAGSRGNSGVEWDDWTQLRVRLLSKDIDLEKGIHEHDDKLWARLHEVEDHGGKPCDCPEIKE